MYYTRLDWESLYGSSSYCLSRTRYIAKFEFQIETRIKAYRTLPENLLMLTFIDLTRALPGPKLDNHYYWLLTNLIHIVVRVEVTLFSVEPSVLSVVSSLPPVHVGDSVGRLAAMMILITIHDWNIWNIYFIIFTCHMTHSFNENWIGLRHWQ